MPYQRVSIADIAEEVKESLRRGDELEARRLAFNFIETYDKSAADEQVRIVRTEPSATGDRRFDALLAAIVEFVCARNEALAPAWVNSPDRFLEPWWFVSGMSTLHADAIVHSPISFARRGVFVTEDALTYV